MSAKLAEILEKVANHAASVDHHWAELVSLGLEMNREMRAAAIDLERLPTLRHTMAEFVRDSRGAADLSLMAACVRNEVLYYMRNIQHQHHQREKICKVA